MAYSPLRRASSVSVGQSLYRTFVGACELADKQHSPRIRTDHVIVSMSYRATSLGRVFPPRRSLLSGATQEAAEVMADEAPPGTTDLEIMGCLRQAHWETFGMSGNRRRRRSVVPQWAAETKRALGRALDSARVAGSASAGNRHMLAALLAEPTTSALQLVERHGISTSALNDTLRQAWPDDERLGSMLNFLKFWGAIEAADAPTSARRAAWGSRFTTLIAQTSPILFRLETEAVVQAVRLAHPMVMQGHLLLAVLVLEDQLRTSGLRPRVDQVATNASVFAQQGVDLSGAVGAMVDLGSPGPPAQPARRRSLRINSNNPPWGISAANAVERARDIAAERKELAGSVHLLLAVAAETDQPAGILLNRLGVSPAELLRDAERSLPG